MLSMYIARLYVVILGVLPALISPVKNDLFIHANKMTSRIATPAHCDLLWSDTGSLTVRCQSTYRNKDCVQLLCCARTPHDSTEQHVTISAFSIYISDSLCMSVTLPVMCFGHSLACCLDAWALNAVIWFPSWVLLMKKTSICIMGYVYFNETPTDVWRLHLLFSWNKC